MIRENPSLSVMASLAAACPQVKSLCLSSHLPLEIAELILSRVPVISLLRFRTVCKAWRSLIGSPAFIQLHFKNYTLSSSTPHHFIVHSTVKSESEYRDFDDDNLITLHIQDPPRNDFISLNFSSSLGKDDKASIPPLSNLALIASPSNGIVCVLVILASGDDLTYLWNPATRTSKRLPPHTLHLDGVHESISLGFGFDPIANDYKVVRFLSFFDQKWNITVEVYSVNRGCWREIKFKTDEDDEVCATPSSCIACIDGMLYWDGYDALIEFDLNEEVFSTIEFPDLDEDEVGMFSTVAEYKDSIAIMTQHRYLEEVYLWSIDFDTQNGYSWSKKWTRKLYLPEYPRSFQVFAYMKSGDIIMADDAEQPLLVYALENRETIRPPIPSGWCINRVLINYTDSLVSFS